jgi:lipopolysaccharide/colanic/teichoic acid biosynthesis glycosyltransferase
MSYHFLLIGGSGFIGTQISRHLIDQGHTVTVVSARTLTRSDLALGKIPSLVADIAGVDAVVMLSVINNDSDAAEAEVWWINVDLPLALLLEFSKYSKVPFFLFGSTHADDLRKTDLYSRTKMRLFQEVKRLSHYPSAFYIIPPVYGRQFVKKMSKIDVLPVFVRSIIVTIIGAFFPIIHSNLIANQINQDLTEFRKSRLPLVRRLSDDQNRNPVFMFTTRLFDMLIAISILLVFGWLMVLIATSVKATSSGPVLFRQRRVGIGGSEFECLKFRTMAVGTRNLPTHQVSNDATTTIGKILRKYKLDELPQAINILRNDMSWIGPRPCLPSQSELIAERHKLGVFAVKPGITGLSQIRGIDMSDPKKLARSDAEFLQKRSILLYLKITVQTITGSGRGDRLAKSDVPPR